MSYSASSNEYKGLYRGVKRPGRGADCPYHLAPELGEGREINRIPSVSLCHIIRKFLSSSCENSWLLRRRGVPTCRRENEFVEIVLNHS
jgi:hypothetical protein